jgi:RNA polymerase sigma-70 factor (ECF subfamily)
MNADRDWRLGDESLRPSDEAALIAAAQADPAAFGALYRHYLTPVYRYACARLASDEQAADVTQHIFLRALEALPAYEDRGLPFSAWLFRIARNVVIDNARRRRVAIPWQDLPEADHPHALEPEQPEASAIQHDALRRFEALIAPLPDDDRDVITLRFLIGLPTREIAAIVGKSDGAVRMQITRSLRVLKEHAHAHVQAE